MSKPIKLANNRKSKKNGINQVPYAVLLFLFIIVTGIKAYNNSTELAVYWFFGILFGFIIEKSRFCFTACFRDPILVGTTSILKAVLVALFITTPGFGIIQYRNMIAGNGIAGMIAPVGLHTVFGAILFGIGMVIAGGCASGTLVRIGEGFLMQIITLVGFIIGVLWGAHDFGWWSKLFISPSCTIHIPQFAGWYGAVFGQMAVLGFLYFLAEKYERKLFNN
ncbi:hypothetical protein H0A61_01467 [Koleobacter methoxysyntrophicus]|jgi:hypothetical protein|uniref:Sulphur transport domain-containing protein n=1 Tax=Koleobacter methoxysyntrophicus TaxID=2751313 RepID=A0A8A0RNE4_9FIRM|nr:YeeE/YedE thiosulfate transporter family protein [Koleobacter methoxysyntrophicus]QSQ09108.1 hypothetical protein H0A61_01467 [Koleobacter methoxysyntrophicus]